MYPVIKVRLKCDLTRYKPGLVAGVEGDTVGQSGIGDRFVKVRFPNCTLDVLWEGLEIIDEEYLAEQAERKKKEREALRSAKNVVKCLGPLGGFRSLSYEYVKDGVICHGSHGCREDADELIRLFEEYGIPIKEEKEKRASRGRKTSDED